MFHSLRDNIVCVNVCFNDRYIFVSKTNNQEILLMLSEHNPSHMQRHRQPCHAQAARFIALFQFSFPRELPGIQPNQTAHIGCIQSWENQLGLAWLWPALLAHSTIDTLNKRGIHGPPVSYGCGTVKIALHAVLYVVYVCVCVCREALPRFLQTCLGSPHRYCLRPSYFIHVFPWTAWNVTVPAASNRKIWWKRATAKNNYRWR